MLDDPPHQRHRRGGRRQQQILPRLQLQADLDRDFGEPIELHRIDRGGKVALMCGHEAPCRLRISSGFVVQFDPHPQGSSLPRPITRQRAFASNLPLRRVSACLAPARTLRLRRRLAEHLGRDLAGLDRSRNAAIHRNQQQHVLHLRGGAAIGQRALGMNAELGGLAARRGDAEHHEAADLVRQPTALPDVAIDVGIDDVLQRRAKIAGGR
ncbi:hypothetical protein chiPu_0031743, partial [Chiloscyllium punctatum]|nr:hypothetical protein [Chiloscyllium punctatum]